MRRKTSLATALLSLWVVLTLLTACFRTPTISDCPILPGETMEHAAMRELSDLLRSTEGREMPSYELAVYEKCHIDLNIPCDGEEVLPHEGVTYTNDEGNSLTFSLTAPTDAAEAEGLEAGPTIGTVTHSWHFPKDTIQTYNLQSRGNSIYSPYLVTAKSNPKHPHGIASFEGMLIFVYPDADSIMVTRGRLTTTSIYHADASAPDDEQHSVKHITQRVEQFYQWQDDSRCCTESYLQLAQEVEKIRQRRDEEDDEIEENHWSFGYDQMSPNWKHEILSIHNIRNKSAIAQVRVSHENFNTTLKLKLVLERGDWYVDNFIGESATSFDGTVEVYEEQEIYYNEREQMHDYIEKAKEEAEAFGKNETY